MTVLSLVCFLHSLTRFVCRTVGYAGYYWSTLRLHVQSIQTQETARDHSLLVCCAFSCLSLERNIAFFLSPLT